MDHPKCRDCGTRHRLGAEFCPLFKDETKDSAKKNKAKPHPHVLGSEGGAKFDRNAYQRDYMRKWRAKKNALSKS